MICPYCGASKTRVTDKRESGSGEITRRRRQCLKCSKRFTTYERVELLELTVVKKDGRRERFDRNKILSGILKACEKRPVPREKIEKIVNDIEVGLKRRDSTEIQSKEIGELVMKKLKVLDNIAYIRFASVYREFKDISHFEKAVKELKSKK